MPLLLSTSLRSSVAQSVEQVAVNHPVAGSSPARGANFDKPDYLISYRAFFVLFLLTFISFQTTNSTHQ